MPRRYGGLNLPNAVFSMASALGTVASTQKASDQLGQEIRVKPKANLDVNRYVLLIGE